MPNPTRPVFTRRLVDHVTDELVTVLSGGGSFEFNELFLKVYEGLKLRKAASGGEEMLRLRCYEKLRKLSERCLVRKTGRSYCGLKGLDKESSHHKIARATEAIAARAAGPAVP